MSALRVYVAGASSEVYLVRGYIAALHSAGGITITYDWTRDVVEHGADISGLSADERLALSTGDMRGVGTADLFWLIAPTPPNVSTGAWVELGFALRVARPCAVVSGPGAARCIFTDLAERYATHEDGFRRVLAERDRRAEQVATRAEGTLFV